MDYRKQVSDDRFMEKYIDSQIQERKNQERIDKAIKPLNSENKKLRAELAQLKKALKPLGSDHVEENEKYSTVRMQLQIIHYLFGLGKFDQIRTVIQKGEFLSPLLNRNPQRARKPFSNINELTFSANKGVAKNIKRDLTQILELFENFGFKKEAKSVKQDIAAINDKHFKKEL